MYRLARCYCSHKVLKETYLFLTFGLTMLPVLLLPAYKPVISYWLNITKNTNDYKDERIKSSKILKWRAYALQICPFWSNLSKTFKSFSLESTIKPGADRAWNWLINWYFLAHGRLPYKSDGSICWKFETSSYCTGYHILWFQKISSMEDFWKSQRGRGVSKVKVFKRKHGAKLEFPEGVGGWSKPNDLLREG